MRGAAERAGTQRAATQQYVTALVGGQLFGLRIGCVQDVFVVERLTRVPLAKAEIAGVFNLRGRIVTLIDLRRRLGLPARRAEGAMMAIGTRCGGESYGLLIDEIGAVLTLGDDTHEANPPNLDAALAPLAAGVHRLDDGVMVVLDVERVLDLEHKRVAA